MAVSNPKIFSSNPPGVDLGGKTAFIAGAGGLGSNVAMMLARAGLPKFVLADFDVVGEENLNRQHFFLRQVGMPKVEALRENILGVNPAAEVAVFRERLEEENFDRVIPASPDIIFECFDSAESKAEIARFCASRRKETPFVAASGIAGTGPIEGMRVRRINRNFYVVGDGESDTGSGMGVLSSRVTAAAAMQAHVGILLLSGLAK